VTILVGFGPPGSVGIDDITFHGTNSTISRPGPIVLGPNGRLWLTEQQNSPNSITAGMYVMENPTTDASFNNLRTHAYKNMVIHPSYIDVSSDGYIYIVQNGTGITKIKYNEEEDEYISVSDVCIELLEEPLSDIYAIKDSLNHYDIDILYADGTIHSSLDNSCHNRCYDIASGSILC
jgi:hypothetical protein